MPDWAYATRPDGNRESHGLVSACGRWRIAKYAVAGRHVYRLFDGQSSAGIYPSAIDAKKKALELSRA